MNLIPSCPEVHDHMTEYLEHSLPIRKRFGFWMHLVLCHGCDASCRSASESRRGLCRYDSQIPVNAARRLAAVVNDGVNGQARETEKGRAGPAPNPAKASKCRPSCAALQQYPRGNRFFWLTGVNDD